MRLPQQNIIVQSKNGTGKTLAYSTVLIKKLGSEIQEDENIEEESVAIKALILAPTREIAV